ncbi:MAG TPA: 23S rRNA (pseudouridine(1915)-N(3))-methyltransferase RlmH [Chitinispirillaceae bacterium]|jgi:23S rRNA (pseudouridine1915-N3)-methyltransferase|nr:23S rRNA (pseudouridine(1915)-N(3))-methyltransferase RlmH [Chitinispirillaceae bacterium]
MAVEVLDLKIIAIGKVKDPCLRTKVEDYKKRIMHDSRIEIIELKDQGICTESEKIKKLLNKDKSFVFVLGEEGREYDSVSFARRIQLIRSKVTFIIGGAYGLSEEIKKGADEILSLSKLTFTHEIARMLLMEQIYRVISIIQNRSYHK